MKIFLSITILAGFIAIGAFNANAQQPNGSAASATTLQPGEKLALNCGPTINVNGKIVHVVEGLPPGVCEFSHEWIFRVANCLGDEVRLEPHTPTHKELKKYPLAKGDKRLHVVCLENERRKKQKR